MLIAVLVFAVIFAACFADVIQMSAEIEQPMEADFPITWEHLIIFCISLFVNIFFGFFLIPCAFGLFLASLAPWPIIPVGYALALSIFGEQMEQNTTEVMILMYMFLLVLYLFFVELYTGTNSFKEFFLDLSVSSLVVLSYVVIMGLVFHYPLTSDPALKWAPLMF